MTVRIGRPSALLLRWSCWRAARAALGRRHGGASSSSPRSSTPSPSVPTHQVDPNGFPLPERPDCAADAGGTFVRATTSEGNGVGFLLIGTGIGRRRARPAGRRRHLPVAAVRRGARDDVPGRAVRLERATLRAARARGRPRCGTPEPRRWCWAGPRTAAPSRCPRRTGYGHGWQASLSFGGELTLPGFDGRAGIRKWRGPLLALEQQAGRLLRQPRTRDSCADCIPDQRPSSWCRATRTAWTCSTTPVRPGSAPRSTASLHASSTDPRA